MTKFDILNFLLQCTFNNHNSQVRRYLHGAGCAQRQYAAVKKLRRVCLTKLFYIIGIRRRPTCTHFTG